MRYSRAAFVQVCLAFIAVFLFMLMFWAPGIIMAGSAAIPDIQKTEPLHLEIVLERIYLDGEVSEEVVRENSLSMDNLWEKYRHWHLKKMAGSKIVFSKKVDDISPLLKANGYFGITDKGVLTIFNGKPAQANIIQSFFQIDIRKLESHKQQELIDGIPIKTKDHFVEVLETFKTYSTDRS